MSWREKKDKPPTTADFTNSNAHLIDFPVVYDRLPPGDVLFQHPELALPLLPRLSLVRHLRGIVWKFNGQATGALL